MPTKRPLLVGTKTAGKREKKLTFLHHGKTWVKLQESEKIEKRGEQKSRHKRQRKHSSKNKFVTEDQTTIFQKKSTKKLDLISATISHILQEKKK